MKPFFGYLRVSTLKQGEGVSLQEQREAIRRFAEHNRLEIIRWFEEKETAAKRGRPVFGEMLKLVRNGHVQGVVIHKIDRGARNMKDWAELGELIDQGVDVHFVNESLDLHTRGGRLSADIQAVVAADYVRNLREEAKKGIYGRLKQGFYPLPAPLGYLDRGAGKAKEIDPVQGPLVRHAFELYATQKYNLLMLGDVMEGLGLRNRKGGRVTRNGLSVMLHNPFYIGLLRLKRTGEFFSGAHEPLVPKPIFDRAQEVLGGKAMKGVQVHDFLFRRMIVCKTCGYSVIGERQKGHVYYRCQTKDCPTTCLREECIENTIEGVLSLLTLTPSEKRYLKQRMRELKVEWQNHKNDLLKGFELRCGQIADRINRLTDAYIDRMIEKSVFEERKATLLSEKKDVEEKLDEARSDESSFETKVTKFLELAGNALIQYKSSSAWEKRDLLKIMTSNRVVEGKKVELTLVKPFSEIFKIHENVHGGPQRAEPRILDTLADRLFHWFKEHPFEYTVSSLSPARGENFPEATSLPTL